MNLFDFDLPKFRLGRGATGKKKIRLISLFSGYDSQKLAFDYLGVDVEHYRAIEFDKYAIDSLNKIHNTDFKCTDITQICGEDLGIVDVEDYDYVMTYSFPCQDLSLAGARRGMDKGSGTRSGLLWEVERLLKESCFLPQILIMENVPQVLSANGWKDWMDFLESLGYNNNVKVLNAKDFGIPQNRKRAFMVSVLGDYTYEFPSGFELKTKLKDLFDGQVEDKYYLSDKMISYIIANNEKWTGNNNKSLVNKSIASTINTGEGSRRCDASNYICDNIEDENVDCKLLISEATKKGYAEAREGDGVYINRPHQKRGVVQKGMIQTIKTSVNDIGVVIRVGNYSPSRHNASTCVSGEGVAPTVMENHGTVTAVVEDKPKLVGGSYNYQLNDLRIRKLTPKECFKLMGVKVSDYEKIEVSNTQKYKQAGNSIVTTVLMAIYSGFFEDYDCDYKACIEKLVNDLKEGV